MKSSSSGGNSTGFEVWIQTVSGSSLLITTLTAMWLWESPPGGKPDVGAVMGVFALALLQAAGFVATVGIPCLVFIAKRRLHLRPLTIWLAVAALIGIAAGITYCFLIPSGPDC